MLLLRVRFIKYKIIPISTFVTKTESPTPMMNKSNKLLSDIVSFRTYAKHLPEKYRREMMQETMNRYMVMMLDRFPKLTKEIISACSKMHNYEVLPSMRALQFGGDAIIKNNLRSYNCSFVHIDHVKVFGELLFVSLSGTGVGYSVQRRHVNKLPILLKPREKGRYVIHDSIEGWAAAVDVLFEAYYLGRIQPEFDFSDIRPQGAYLKTTGAKAPGPEPLRKILEMIESRLKKAVGRRLRPIEVHDICCILSECVLAGGIRRAALICLFDRTDDEMLKCKAGEWWIEHPYRGRANNSAVLPRSAVKKEQFDNIFKACIESNSGEPGFFWTDNENWGANPCLEISLQHGQLCNLTTVNQANMSSASDWYERVQAAAFLGTLQASFTDFHYLRDVWRKTTEAEALIGVSCTGIADQSNFVPLGMHLAEAARLAVEKNIETAGRIGINPAARVTALKPEGSASCVLGTSSGIHARHDKHYIRRVRMNKNDVLAQYLMSKIPHLVEPDKFNSNDVVVSIPQASPDNAILRLDDSAKTLFNRVMSYQANWIAPGHVQGDNKNNVSVTISYKPEEIEELRETLWENRYGYTGVSLLPFDGGSYIQAPFESCDEATFNQLSEGLTEIDLSEITESVDGTSRTEVAACAGGNCEVT